MTVLIAPDSFKGTYTAREVADAVATGVESSGGTAIRLPVADGGEGTLDVLTVPLGLRPVTTRSRNPWGSPCRPTYGLSDDGTAVIEIAAASGITTPHDGPRDPVTATTYGTGMLVADAARRGARRIVVAAGGSATTDGGTGAVAAIEAGGGLRGAAVTVLTDVTTRYVDAARVFGPQKGADAVQLLTRQLEAKARALPRDPSSVDATGAAGGFSGGMWARYGAELRSGADYILDVIGFDTLAADASAIVVGEGRLDGQTKAGKIISAILARAGTAPVYAVVGSVGDDLGDYRSRFAGVLVATNAVAMHDAGRTIAAQLMTGSGHPASG
ncbi:glycerate kinase [Rhodococcus sp. IEGM 1307]|uniref:glycerate kinase family protein n=1 Tax=Rhodococcus sp. IEGM 1307 TaxID=3047091 RepID=UPI0024B7F6C7|nr:glycerate kinase [Rhodococcus sp. IEGM 1307]MDI9972302.1 glycerate kinase [Rhodococcus sp. IEGM 1307]